MKRMSGVYNIDQLNIQKEIDEYIQSTPFRESNILNIGILQIRRLNLWYTFYELGT
jgi:hypothetical protein